MSGVETTEANPVISVSRSNLLEKMRGLNESLNTVEQTKKDTVKDYNEEIKSLKEEIKDTLDVLNDTP